MLCQASCSVEPVGIAAREHGHGMKWLFALLLLLIALHGDRASASTRIHTKSPGSEVSWAGPLFPGNSVAMPHCHLQQELLLKLNQLYMWENAKNG